MNQRDGKPFEFKEVADHEMFIGSKYGKNQRLLDDFIDSGFAIAEVDCGLKTAQQVHASLLVTLRRSQHFKKVFSTVQNNKLYLVNCDKAKNVHISTRRWDKRNDKN